MKTITGRLISLVKAVAKRIRRRMRRRPLPSKVFDRPLRNFSGRNSDKRSLQAIKLVKELRPDLWQRFTEHERNDEGYTDISPEIDKLLKDHMGISGRGTVMELVDLCGEIRKQVRREAGLWY